MVHHGPPERSSTRESWVVGPGSFKCFASAQAPKVTSRLIRGDIDPEVYAKSFQAAEVAFGVAKGIATRSK